MAPQEHRDKAAARKRRRDGLVGLVILVGGLVLVAGLFAFPWFDTLGQRWVSCDVVEARPFQGDNTSPQPWKLQLQTTNCQDVIYSDGVTEDNVEQLADSIDPGPYEIKMGWVSQRLADGWLPTLAPTAQEYRRVEE